MYLGRKSPSLVKVETEVSERILAVLNNEKDCLKILEVMNESGPLPYTFYDTKGDCLLYLTLSSFLM